jgi:hypothetical protein
LFKHVFVVCLNNPNGNLTKESLQDFLSQHDGNVRVVGLKGYVAHDDEEDAFTGAELTFALD